MSCPDCFSGSVHEGTPRGRMAKICGLPTYVSEPGDRAAKAIIVIIPDAFGIDFVNNKILADHYAEKGDYLVYLPDFMAGMSVELLFQPRSNFCRAVRTDMDAKWLQSHGEQGQLSLKTVGQYARGTSIT